MSLDPTGITEAITTASSLIKDGIDKIWPNPTDEAAAKVSLIKANTEAALAQVQVSVDLAKQQTDIDKVEAASSSVFVAGWRPFVGWVGGVAFAYVSIIEPAARFIAAMCHYTGVFPAIDTTITMQMLTGLLGFGALRSYDKKQGTSPQGHA